MRVIGGELKGVSDLAKRLGMDRPAQRELVGIPAGKTEPDGESMAQVGAWVEFGTEASATHPGSPERPYMRQGIRAGEMQIRRVAKHDLREVGRGEMTMRDALGRMGEVGAGAVKKYMAGDNFEANAPATVAKKGSSQPTIDSTALRGSITHVPETT